MTKDVWALSALEMAERIAAKDISSREVIGAHLARIEAVNPAVNAVTVPKCARRLIRISNRPSELRRDGGI